MAATKVVAQHEELWREALNLTDYAHITARVDPQESERATQTLRSLLELLHSLAPKK